ncbi:MAG: Citrate synthase [Gemmatimonadetes bacterium]|nr:Citrate synthase [Gemmatimonadota bacterium]
MAAPSYLSAGEARRELGVTAQTLYAYVSRGMIRSEPAPDGSRTRRYHAEDVRRLKDRKAARRDPEQAARGALRWGAPVLDSALTLVTDGRIFYRGHDAVELARSRSVEQVAALLWTGAADVPHGWFGAGVDGSAGEEDVGPLAAMQIELARQEARDPATWDLRPERAARTGARILERLTAVATEGSVDGEAETIPERLQRAWAPRAPEAEPLLRAAMILLADHELNVASFTARCVASAGSTAYAAVSAGLGALQGSGHARNTERVEALFREAGAPEGARTVVRARMRRGEPIPGFGHRLHPSGDPRAVELLRLLREVRPASPALALADALVEAAEALMAERPTVEVALVALSLAFDLPPDAPLVLFALGRTLGLVAHAVEQYRCGEAIRPRARYTGAVPAELGSR